MKKIFGPSIKKKDLNKEIENLFKRNEKKMKKNLEKIKKKVYLHEKKNFNKEEFLKDEKENLGVNPLLMKIYCGMAFKAWRTFTMNYYKYYSSHSSKSEDLEYNSCDYSFEKINPFKNFCKLNRKIFKNNDNKKLSIKMKKNSPTIKKESVERKSSGKIPLLGKNFHRKNIKFSNFLQIPNKILPYQENENIFTTVNE